MGLRKLADSASWRTGFPKLTIAGTNVKLTVANVTWQSAPAVKLISRSPFNSDSSRYYGSSYDTLTSSVIVTMNLKPSGIRGAYTAFGPINQEISNMNIDGRD